jgi:ElaB/YqjD/DUF883 family membrane-anchored ribosome-binding protein
MAYRSASELDALRDDVAQLREDLKNLMGTMSGLSHDVAEIVSTRVDRTAHDVRSMAGKASHDAKRMAEKAGDRMVRDVKHYTDSFERSISSHPFGAATIALALGMVIGRLIDRSRRD